MDRIKTNTPAAHRAFAIVFAAMAITPAALAQSAASTPSASVVASVPTVPTGLGNPLNQRHHHRDSDDGDPFSTQQRQRFPFYASIGFYNPNFSDDGISSTGGGELAVGYRLAMDNVDVRFSLRSQTFSLDDDFGNHTDATVGQLGVDAVYRFTQFYAGGGVALGQVSGITDGFAFQGSDATVWSVMAGYDITPRIFVEGRWQTATIDAYKGYSISVGYRF